MPSSQTTGPACRSSAALPWFVGLGWILAACAMGLHPDSILQAEEQTAAPPPVLSMTVSGPRLRLPENDLKGKAVYGLASIFQVSPTEAAAVVNVRFYGLTLIDYEAGSDVVIFDSLDAIRADRAIPLERNERVHDPETGLDLVKVKYPPSWGFVPLGAKLADGRPHPHAGTGFGLGSVVFFPLDRLKARDLANRRGGGSPVMQLSYDGRRLEIVSQEPIGPDLLPEGWSLAGDGMTAAIPDGEDLLAGSSMQNGPGYACAGMCRWRRTDAAWRMVEFVPITPKDGARESSLVRDADGTLLFSARGAANPPSEDPESRFAWRMGGCIA
jgi:hypothetical protein